MHTIIISILALLPASTVAFLPVAPHGHGNVPVTRVLATSKPDMSGDTTIDVKQAKYCADHFGECSLEDMDRIRNGELVAECG